MILLCKVDDPQRFGIAELDKENLGKIKKIMEKPKNSPSDLSSYWNLFSYSKNIWSNW